MSLTLEQFLIAEHDLAASYDKACSEVLRSRLWRVQELCEEGAAPADAVDQAARELPLPDPKLWICEDEAS
jgi:hypothetical protein